MKKILLILIPLLIFAGSNQAQNANIMSATNSYIVDTTHPLLDSAGVFTGGAQSLIGYNSLSVTIRSDKKGYLKILFGNTSTITTLTATRIDSFNYTANDVQFSKVVGINAPYFKVVYQNDSTAATGATQTKFYLITMLNRGQNIPITSNGKLDVDAITITGGATTLVDGSNSIIGVATSPIYTTPDYAYVRTIDTWGAAKDTSTYNFNNLGLKCYITIYDSSATADTLTIEAYSYAKLGWTTQMIGLKDVATGIMESDPATVIITGTYAKTFEINKYRVEQIRVRPKTLTGRTVFKTKRIVWERIN
jgi:hypothetical protein